VDVLAHVRGTRHREHAVVEAQRVDEVLAAALEREEKERVKAEKLAGGALSYDLDGLRAKVEGAVS
jgi:hypothetical protein